MAEILDVVTRLSYDFQGAGLNAANQALEQQLKLTKELNKSGAKGVTKEQSDGIIKEAKAREANANAAIKEAKARDLNASAGLKEARTQAVLQKASENLLKAREKAFTAMAREQKATDENSRAYKQLSSEYNIAKQRAQDFGASLGTTHPKFIQASADANSLYNKLLTIDKALGDSRRQVGNYGIVVQGLDKSLNQLSFATSQIARELSAFTYSFQTGLLAITNNIPIFLDRIDDLRKQGASTVEIFKGIGKSLLSLNGIITIAISLVTIFGDKLFASSKQAKEAKSAYDQYIESVEQGAKQTLKSTDQQVNELRTLIKVIKDANLTEETRAKALNQLKNSYGGYLKDIDLEKIKTGEAEAAIRKVTEAIAAKEKASFGQAQIVELQEQERDLINQQRAAQEKLNKVTEAREKVLARGLEGSPASRRAQRKALDDFVTDATRKFDKLVNDLRNKRTEISNLQQRVTVETVNSADLLFTSTDTPPSKPKKIQEDLEELAQFLDIKGKKSLEELGQLLIDFYNQPDTSLKAKLFNSFDFDPQEANKKVNDKFQREKFIFGDVADIEDPEKRRREEIEKSIDAYGALATAAKSAFNSIYQAQIASLDAEIQIRQTRVTAALKLAERGNVDALKIEQDRLEQTIKQREQFARQQQTINAALAVSDAIVAVASAASQSGAGAVVIVPAVIAAIVAGYAAIASATRESTAQGFATGVVSLDGKGTSTSDSIPARLSKGESVITAKATAKNRDLLELANKGYDLHMLMQPKYQEVAKSNNKQTEKLLQGVIDTVSGLKFRAENRLDRNGVHQLIETEQKIERNRWK